MLDILDLGILYFSGDALKASYEFPASAWSRISFSFSFRIVTLDITKFLDNFLRLNFFHVKIFKDLIIRFS